MSRVRLIACVLLPFAAGYFLSYLFRTVNAVIAADLGMLTAVYFLVFGAVQLPLGALLDRLGPCLVQSVLMLLTATVALIFASSDSFAGLVVRRAIIGAGLAVALMAGLKAIVIWFPQERLTLVNGWLVTLGTFSALAATGPARTGGADDRLARPLCGPGWSFGSGGTAGSARRAGANRNRTSATCDPQLRRHLPRCALLARRPARRAWCWHILVAAGLVGGTLVA